MKTTKERIEEFGYKKSFTYPEVIEYTKTVECDDWYAILTIYFNPETKEFEIEFSSSFSLEELHHLVAELDKLEVK